MSYQQMQASNHRVNTVHALIAWAAAVLTFAYFLPWAIAATRGKSNSLAIALVNLLLGWTIIGWVVALVMSCGSHQTVVVHNHIGYGYPPPGGPYAPGPIQPQLIQPPAYPPLTAPQPPLPLPQAAAPTHDADTAPVALPALTPLSHRRGDDTRS